ncbi:acyl-CoA reductase [Deminuibacter soli]|uniref:Acyl-CoA reductase n=1 Tax=Deminuibacter soli TaxID=2291815 RepID=A0A3E1NLT3_9BACT|nr:acyl-CoA reductase [Deminuibacter soli]RFM28877.1 acyl-CoA reductase [Deminuibacter soli]
MTVQQRIDLLVRLGHYMQQPSDAWELVKERASRENAWFTPEFINLAVNQLCTAFLQQDKLTAWAAAYGVPVQQAHPKKVGIVMAGNIPLVGFHDLLAVFITGHYAVIKPSSKDDILLKHLVQQLASWDHSISESIQFADLLKGCDAYIATGSNNTGRYFDYYFGRFPHIIRRNRTSVAVLDGLETQNELSLLADDIQLYFGLGCRNVTKLYVPKDYDFLPLLDALKKYDYLLENHKYKHNYDYHLALLLMNSKYYMNNGNLVLTEHQAPFSPVSQVHFEYYTNRETLAATLHGNTDIQCVTGHHFIPFGQAQHPSLTDYADGVDTMAFLVEI